MWYTFCSEDLLVGCAPDGPWAGHLDGVFHPLLCCAHTKQQPKCPQSQKAQSPPSSQPQQAAGGKSLKSLSCHLLALAIQFILTHSCMLLKMELCTEMASVRFWSQHLNQGVKVEWLMCLQGPPPAYVAGAPRSGPPPGRGRGPSAGPSQPPPYSSYEMKGQPRV